MSSYEALDLLRLHDPAADLEPVSVGERERLREGILAGSTRSRPAWSPRPARLLALAVVLSAAVVGVSVAWAAGHWSPPGLFQANPQHEGGTAGDLWNQQVVPGTVRRAATVQIPHVGPVAFWYGDTTQHGWCAGLRLPGGEWVGTGESSLDAGGTLPGCFPTREQVNRAGTPVYVINGFDYEEGDVDARKAGGSFWRIRYGEVKVPGAVRIADLASGRSVAVHRGGLFALAIPDPNPMGRTPLHLVAYGANGKVVADDSRP
jgi:hypothetical protein